MNIDVRKLISVTLYTIMTKSDRRIICWDNITTYISLLERRLEKEIKLVYEDNFNEQQYEEFIYCNVESNNALL